MFWTGCPWCAFRLGVSMDSGGKAAEEIGFHLKEKRAPFGEGSAP